MGPQVWGSCFDKNLAEQKRGEPDFAESGRAEVCLTALKPAEQYPVKMPQAEKFAAVLLENTGKILSWDYGNSD